MLFLTFTKMVHMGHIMKAQVSDQDRAEVIAEHARRKMLEATDRFHSTLDDLEIEIVSPPRCACTCLGHHLDSVTDSLADAGKSCLRTRPRPAT